MYVSWANSLLCLADRCTGYGREEYSPSRQVSFDPEARSVETILIKYELCETLCRMNIISCGTTYGRPHNRLWDDHGYAPRRLSGREFCGACSLNITGFAAQSRNPV